jgi:bifunctional DNA-binding transcriptional regulator/antitoxin component of YhaV-PrlF toxin-antitoxin module
MSSKRQVVIPEVIRKQPNLKDGVQFVVVRENDVVILKSILPPTMNQIDDLISKVRSQDRQAGLKKAGIRSAIVKLQDRK